MLESCVNQELCRNGKKVLINLKGKRAAGDFGYAKALRDEKKLGFVSLTLKSDTATNKVFRAEAAVLVTDLCSRSGGIFIWGQRRSCTKDRLTFF